MNPHFKPRLGQLVEEEINGGYAAFPGNDEVSSSVSWSLTWTARYPLDPPAIARHIGLGDWLVLEVRVSCLDRARDPIDLVTAAVAAVVGVIEHAILGEYFVDDRAPTRGIILTEDVEIASQ